jgi:hypothetical protein
MKTNKSKIESQQEQLDIPVVMCCTFCDTEISDNELTYTEDSEPSHKKCLDKFEQHWKDRDEMMDLMGY